MRKIICYIATSADGYIARPDGGVDWLERHPSPKGHYGYADFFKTIDTVVWGRKTFDLMKQWGRDLTADFGPRRHYVFSRTGQAGSQDPNAAKVQWVTGDPGGLARNLRASKGKNIWMMGGGGIIGSFLDVGGIDEFVIHVIPTFIGEGIPLIAPRHLDVPLRVRSTRKYPDGVVRLHYDVAAGTNRPKRDVSRTGAKAARQR